MKVISSIEDAVASIGQELGVSSWKEVTQQRIDEFAAVTEDEQWIHVDARRAQAESPYGTTIAHGFLTLALIPALCKENYVVTNRKMGINYGMNKVRFLAPVVAGSRIRARSHLLDVATAAEGTADLTVRHTVEIEGSDKPAAVVELIVRIIFATPEPQVAAPTT
ncbi:MaoC family dehydratase [Mycolicibacterium pulveris]|uniref:MaoC family dehydratase n=1 Tax=Mycolicibacterium pulveris TaxID=36813 RepID=UPI0013D535AE|nr:MaoC family dehydratase [Mycolicibacterium pulveris]MCV6983848.1 MaoC family dehydratase [Mycolicibacterium pulveris]